MAFMSKEELINQAEQLNVDLTGLSYAKQQAEVAKARKDAGLPVWGKGEAMPRKNIDPIPDYQMAKVLENEAELRANSVYNNTKSEEAKLRAKKLMGNRDPLNPLTQYNNKTILIAPEIKPTVKTLAYQEDLGDELDIDVIELDPDTVDNVSEGQEWNTQTYKIKGKTGRKVKAKSHLPKQQPMLFFRPDIDIVPVAELLGRKGYLFKHTTMPCIKTLLIESGYYEEFKKEFSNNNNMFYLGGLLCCDIGFTNHILSIIEKKAQTDGDSRY